jgi:hypothetical protein
MAMTLVDHITSANEERTMVSVDTDDISNQLDAINQLLD